jgi:hypothetical protein
MKAVHVEPNPSQPLLRQAQDRLFFKGRSGVVGIDFIRNLDRQSRIVGKLDVQRAFPAKSV